MPTFEFTSPDGKTYEVTGPDGATKEQAFQILQNQLSSGQAVETKPESAASSVLGRAAEMTKYIPGLGIANMLRTAPQMARKMAEDPEKNIPEMLMHQPAVQVATSAASPFLGIGQMADRAIRNAPIIGPAVGVATDKAREAIKSMTGGRVDLSGDIWSQYRQAEKSAGVPDITPEKVMGLALSPVPLKIAKSIPVVGPGSGLSKLGTQMFRSGVSGATVGATTPVDDADNLSSEEFWNKKLKQTGYGAAFGTMLPVAVRALSGVGGLIGTIKDVMSGAKGADSIARKHLLKIVGNDNVDDVIAAINKYKRAVPGDRPTVGNLVAETPSGSPLVAQQKAVFGVEGGISKMAGERAQQQLQIVEQARERLNARMGPIKDRIFANAGQVNTNSAINTMKGMMNRPEVQGNRMAMRVLKSVYQDIKNMTNRGLASPEGLHTVRQIGINQKIKQFMQGASKADKARAGKILDEVKGLIDDAIENAGGVGWKKWLSTYSKHIGEINKISDRVKLIPYQTTRLEHGGVGVGSKEAPQLFAVLSRPVVIANWMLKKMSEGVSVEKAMAQMFLNPSKMVSELQAAQSSMAPGIISTSAQRAAPSLTAMQTDYIGKQK